MRPGALGLLCRLSDDPAVPALLAGINEHALDPTYTPEDELNIIWGPDELPEPAANPPTFRNLQKTGLLCSTRVGREGLVRVQFIGGPAGAGHGHDDRGSFVLEAFGEELAIERGQMPYVDPRSATIKQARYHNLAIPHDENGQPMRQHNPCPVDSIAQGEGDETRLHCRMNLNGVWPEPVTDCSRELASDSPQELLVIDRITAARPIQGRILSAKPVSLESHRQGMDYPGYSRTADGDPRMDNHLGKRGRRLHPWDEGTRLLP